jgi:hypothetical protein
MTFRRWLKAQAGRGDSVGDLAEDVVNDPIRGNWKTASELRSHIVHNHSRPGQNTSGALEAVKLAGKEWRLWSRLPGSRGEAVV